MIGKKVRLDSFDRCAPGHRGGRFRAVRPVPAGHGNHRQHRDQLASSFSDHGNRPDTPDDRIVRQAGAGRGSQTARAELRTVYGVMKREHPEDYPAKADFQISAVKLRDQLTSGARTILLVLMAASVLVFVIACSNVANLILARTVRRENELGIRAALGASTGALRRTLLAESLLLCVAGQPSAY